MARIRPPALPAAPRRRPGPHFWLLAVLAAMAAPSASAASLQASPITVEFRAADQAQALWLTNTGDAPVHAQVRIQRWTQEGGSEQLTASREIVASPAIVEVAPGQKQLVRLMRPQASAPAGELAYRVIVDELPEAGAPAQTGLNLLLRYSIPAFVLPAGVTPYMERTSRTPPTDMTKVSATLSGGTLAITNHDQSRLRITQLAYVNADGSRVALNQGLFGYVLAGQRMQWPLALPSTARPGGSLHALFNRDTEEQALPLASATP